MIKTVYSRHLLAVRLKNPRCMSNTAADFLSSTAAHLAQIYNFYPECSGLT